VNCSSNGWCGNAEEHCGARCQAGFGDCGSSSSPDYSVSPQASRSGPPSYGSPAPSAYPISQPGSGSPSSYAINAASSEQSGTETSPPAYSTYSSESTTSAPSETTFTVDSATSSSQSSDEPATTAPLSSGPASSSASPIETSVSTSSYDVSAPTASDAGGQSQGGPYISTFKGDGSHGNGWPTQDQWLSFDTLWEINQPIMTKSCSISWALGSGTDNTAQELADVKSAIADISAQTKIDKAFIYAIMQQESLGCVRVRTTSFSHANPGLFQSNQGTGSCNDGGNLQIPCPQSEIHQMVQDGVAGTPSGDGLLQLFDHATGETAQKYYRAARMYNSGSLDPSGSLGRGGATACYCSDIANRLLGWSQGPSQCTVPEVST
jgi:hypothetical protein